jgi:hypothetical protein
LPGDSQFLKILWVGSHEAGTGDRLEPLHWSLTSHRKPTSNLRVRFGSTDHTSERQVLTFTADSNGHDDEVRRCPDLDEQFRLAPDDTFSEYEAKGRSTFGAPVDDHFTLKEHLAQWKSTSESGSRVTEEPAQYVPMNSSVEAYAISVAAIRKRPDGKLGLLPNGTLTQSTLDEVRLSTNGKSRLVQLVAQTGLGFTPAFFWVTPGSDSHMFAAIYPGWASIVEEGWLESQKLLLERQLAAERKLLATMAMKLQRPLQGLTAIRNARVFDSNKAQLTGSSDVYVLRGRIAAVVPAGTGAVAVENDIDAAGRVLLPGLFDMHVHVGRWDGGLHLAAGVTSVRDMGNDNEQMQQMLDETARGTLLSPQIIPTGFLEGASPYSSTNRFLIKDLIEAKKAIDWYVAHGYPQLKIYNSFPFTILQETVAYAHSRGMRVSGHVPAFMRADDVLDQGFDEIQHVNQVLLNFFVKPDTDTRTLERFYLPAKRVADLDLDSKPVLDLVAKMQRRGTVIDPTLNTFDFLRQRDGQMSAPFAAVADHVPADIKRGLFVGQMNIPDDATAKIYNASYLKMVDFIGRIYRAGVPLVAGTDSMAGFGLQGEIELYVQAGLTPAQALQIATLNGAHYAGVAADRGSITVGKLADLVLVDGDPTQQIGDIRKVSLVITRCQLIEPMKVYATLGIKPFTQWLPEMKLADPLGPSSDLKIPSM